MPRAKHSLPSAYTPSTPDWRRVVEFALLSRALDELEESMLTPARKVLYQFSARGHEVTQALLAQLLTGAARWRGLLLPFPSVTAGAWIAAGRSAQLDDDAQRRPE